MLDELMLRVGARFQAWFYKWRDGHVPGRAARRAALAAEVTRLFKAHRGTCGSPRITADLRDEGWAVSVNTVAAVMRELGLAARPRRRRSLTRPGKGRWRAPDLVRRDFTAEAVNQKWFGDGTEITTGEGKLYLASVLDVGSRRILGFALSEHHDAQLAYGALAMAAAVRGGQAEGVILHTDRAASTPRGRSGGRAPGCRSASRSAGPARSWTTRSSSRSTPPWSSSCGRWRTSPPGPGPGAGSRPGSMTTTPSGGIRRSG
jgi:transposase InsO family protein